MDLEKIKFSVLLPILDRPDIEDGFPLAVKSIFSNTLIPNQVVVVVDGPVNDQFKKVISKFKKNFNLDIIWNEEKIGLDKALNIGLLKCKNDFIFRADGDDINLHYRFEKQLPFLIDGYDVIGSNIDEFDNKGSYLFSVLVPQTDKEIKGLLPFRNPINHMTVAFSKKAVLEVGGYPELYLKGDYGLWIKLNSFNKKFININESLVKATTGKRMINDRGGIKYIFSEFLLQKFMIKNNCSNYIQSVFVFLLRSTVFIFPSELRSFFYKYFLRKVKINILLKNINILCFFLAIENKNYLI